MGFISCLFISAVFAYLINGRGGVMLIVCLLTSLALSVINILAVRKKFTFVMSEANFNSLRKKENFQVVVQLSKRSFLPTPYVEVKLRSSPNLLPKKSELFKAAVSSNKKPVNITAEYSAGYSGAGFVEIESVKMTDYLGIISFSVFKSSEDNRIISEFNVLPDIPMVNSTGELLKSSTDAVAFDDNDEDTGETARYGRGVPGYEHRQYVPGDPLKRINWKLSSKRDIFMVRLDEKVAVTSQKIVLDVFSEKITETQQLIDNDILVEGCMCMLSSMLRQELQCQCWYWAGGFWDMVDVSDEASLNKFQEIMGGYDFYKPHSPRLPDGLKSEKGSSAAIIFTNSLDASITSAAESSGSPCFFAATAQTVKQPCDDLWIVDDTFEFKRF